jgi:hypothetical protein
MGRPPVIDTPEQFDLMVDLYVLDRTAIGKPFNIVDLALYLGLSSKDRFYEQANRKDHDFSRSVARAKAIVEEGHVDRVNRGIAHQGNMFLLKASYGYQEKTVIEVEPMTVNIEGKDSQL